MIGVVGFFGMCGFVVFKDDDGSVGVYECFG